jgi:hypothetical protein
VGAIKYAKNNEMESVMPILSKFAQIRWPWNSEPLPEPGPPAETPKPAKPRAKRIPKPKPEPAVLSAKEQATAEKRPYVNVLGLDFDPKNPTLGSFELDWNEYFIKQLLVSGYQGETEEQLVDQWFRGICRHVVDETWEQDQADPTNRVTRRDLGNGRTEIG